MLKVGEGWIWIVASGIDFLFIQVPYEIRFPGLASLIWCMTYSDVILDMPRVSTSYLYLLL